MLGKRLLTAIPMIGGFLAVLWLDTYLEPWFPFWLIAMFVGLIWSAREMVGLLNATTVRPSNNTVVAGVAALILSNWIPHVLPLHLEAGHDPAASLDVLAWPFVTFVAVVMVCFIAQSVQFVQPGRTMATIAGTVLVVAYVGLLGSFLIQTRWLEGPHRGLLPLAALIATAKGADTGAYTVGRIAGRQKLWPRLSPAKTVEGAIGGLAFSVGGAFIIFGLGKWLLREQPFSWTAVLGFGLIVGAAAQLGDLMESMIKRDCERKDASQALPGFGGVLDVLDSLLFAGPVAYSYWLFFAP